MNNKQENQWREEFEGFYKDVDSAPNFKTNKYGGYSCIYAQENWSTYLAARKKTDEEITQLKEELKRERFFSSKFELQAMRGFPTGKEWYYLVKEHLKIQKQRRVEL